MPPDPSPRRHKPAVIRRARWFVGLLAASVVATVLPLPWALVGLPTSIAAGVVAVILLFSIRGTGATGLLILSTMGLLLTGLLAATFSMEALFYREFQAFQECRANAVTVAASASCQKTFEEAVNARLHGWQSRLAPDSSPSPSASTSP